MVDSITKILTGKTPYIGKLGLDNFLLILAGILYFCLYAVKHREKPYKRLRLEFFQGMFYVVFGFGFDLYRLKSLRGWLLMGYLNFLPFRLLILLLAILPVIVQLTWEISYILRKRRSERVARI